MLFIAENELEKALVAAAKDRTAAPDFYRLLLETDLLVLGTVEGQEDASDKFPLAPGGKLNLVPAVKDGSQYLPVFSSLVRMQEFVEQESKFLSINGRALLEITRGAPITLNPASQYGKELSPAEVKHLLDGAPSQRPVRTIAGEAEYPALLVRALTPVFSARPDIDTAWVIHVAPAGRADEAHPLVGVETTGDWPSLMQAVQAAVKASVPDMVFDIQRVDRRNPGGLASALIQAAPFYVRGVTLN